MTIDKVTLEDLSFFGENHSVFSLINKCQTQEGTKVLRRHVLNPPKSFALLKEYQKAVQFWMNHANQWTSKITNGTIVMVQKFYETNDLAIDKPNALNLFIAELLEKWFKKKNHSFALFSIQHLSDFIKGCDDLTKILDHQPPKMVTDLLTRLKEALHQPLCQEILATNDKTKNRDWLDLCYRGRQRLKGTVYKMIGYLAQLDAQRGMALAGCQHQWVLPELRPAQAHKLAIKALVHPLLENPVGCDLELTKDQRLLFLTGANMAGKSTLLYALGISTLLAHLGMAVPAKKMTISYLDGMITNMHIEDNIVLGESYFFAEVQRMKQTAKRLQNKNRFLILMDELFKGTNGHDAYECTQAVIKGLLNKSNHLMALSTHITELAKAFRHQPNMLFRYCETMVDTKGHYHFTYRLKKGVSNDRIGFLVLKNEGIMDLLSRDKEGND